MRALYAKTIDAQCNRNNQQFLSRMTKSKKMSGKEQRKIARFKGFLNSN